jgi:hypothetical protein
MGGNFCPITPVMERGPAYPIHFQQPSPVAQAGLFQGRLPPVELPTIHQIRETEEYDEDFEAAPQCLSQKEIDQDEFLILSEFFGADNNFLY